MSTSEMLMTVLVNRESILPSTGCGEPGARRKTALRLHIALSRPQNQPRIHLDTILMRLVELFHLSKKMKLLEEDGCPGDIRYTLPFGGQRCRGKPQALGCDRDRLHQDTALGAFGFFFFYAVKASKVIKLNFSIMSNSSSIFKIVICLKDVLMQLFFPS